jgi:hypothetical protein
LLVYSSVEAQLIALDFLLSGVPSLFFTVLSE